MATARLTKRTLESLLPREQRYTLYDSDVRGFGVRVQPSGIRSWIFEYRPGEGGRNVAKRRVTIGDVKALTPEQARRRAETLRAQTRLGQDPQAEKAAQRRAARLDEIARAFVKEHLEAKRKPRTKALYEDVLNRLILPKLGKMKAKDISRADVARLHLAWQHTPGQANQMLSILSSLYGFADRQGYVPEGFNPVRRVEKYPERMRERYLLQEELKRLGAALQEAETVGIPWHIRPNGKTKHVPKEQPPTIIGEHAAAAIRLLLFTGARLREILHLKWEHVDFDRGLLLLPDSKTGRKTIILNAPALDVLMNLSRTGVYVIAGDSAGSEDEKPRRDLKRPWNMVRRRAELEDVRLHDLRHNFGAFGAGGGLGLPIIGKLLGHTQPSTTARYAHLDADPLRRASNAIGDAIASALMHGPANTR